jgi:predicted dehydrogenase
MIRVGIVGFGYMGRTHFNCFSALKNVKVAAVCDTNSKAFESANVIKGNIKEEGALNLSNVNFYTDYDHMLKNERLDAVSITLPTHLHCESVLKALDAGLHVFCEKPIALNIDDGISMIKIAEDRHKMLQIGHCTRFWPEYAKTREIIESGIYGKIKAAYLERFSAAPQWSSGGWLRNKQLSGGMLMDFHIHDSDYIYSILGMPKSVCSRNIQAPSGDDDYVVTTYLYDHSALVLAQASWSMPQSYGFKMSFTIVLDDAIVVYDNTRQPTLMVFPFNQSAYSPQLDMEDGYSQEISCFVRSLINGQIPSVLAPVDALNSLRLVTAERQSILTGKEVNL